MANEVEVEIRWRRCDECDVPYFIGAVLNPRNHGWSPIPLSAVEDAEGNFHVDNYSDFVEVHDADEVNLGHHPVVVYGQGNYRPHNPSHFLDEVHVHDTQDRWSPVSRMHNFKLRMEDDES